MRFFCGPQPRRRSNRDLRDNRAPHTGRFAESRAQPRAHRAENATTKPRTKPIRFGSRGNGPLPDGHQASAAARTRREQKSDARKRQSHKRWRSRPRYGSHEWCPSCQRVEAAATRRHPLAATLSCPRPPNLRRPVRFDGPRSATSEIRVRASSTAYLGHIPTACRACSVRVASNPTRDGRWRRCRLCASWRYTSCSHV